MNVPAVLALKKVHGRTRCWTFHGILEFQCSATTRTLLVLGILKLHGILPTSREVTNRGRSVQWQNANCSGFVSETQDFGGAKQIAEPRYFFNNGSRSLFGHYG
jgi:hypothetical protein